MTEIIDVPTIYSKQENRVVRRYEERQVRQDHSTEERKECRMDGQWKEKKPHRGRASSTFY